MTTPHRARSEAAARLFEDGEAISPIGTTRWLRKVAKECGKKTDAARAPEVFPPPRAPHGVSIICNLEDRQEHDLDVLRALSEARREDLRV
jgi:hypothetical protein